MFPSWKRVLYKLNKEKKGHTPKNLPFVLQFLTKHVIMGLAERDYKGSSCWRSLLSTHRHYLIKTFLVSESAIICQTFTYCRTSAVVPHIIYLHYRYEVDQRDKGEFVFGSLKLEKSIFAVLLLNFLVSPNKMIDCYSLLL